MSRPQRLTSTCWPVPIRGLKCGSDALVRLCMVKRSSGIRARSRKQSQKGVGRKRSQKGVRENAGADAKTCIHYGRLLSQVATQSELRDGALHLPGPESVVLLSLEAQRLADELARALGTRSVLERHPALDKLTSWLAPHCVSVSWSVLPPSPPASPLPSAAGQSLADARSPYGSLAELRALGGNGELQRLTEAPERTLTTIPPSWRDWRDWRQRTGSKATPARAVRAP